ncbi:unnamed protein product [Hymenolepis diminuta]|uniref:Integrase catalytic domain-containing protein n=1 Tax=Hymenolepis diminuta TaxID=6216 RepID=A0A564YZ81_HYMDI|nr:unnamed protein product [Hymenolepis diminuta]
MVCSYPVVMNWRMFRTSRMFHMNVEAKGIMSLLGCSRMAQDSRTKTCQACLRVKVDKYTKVPLVKFPLPESGFDHVHISLFDPLPLSNCFSYRLTCVARFSRWRDAFPMRHLAAETVVRTFTVGWIAKFDFHSTITTDHGTQFESHLFSELTNLLGTNRIRTIAYHPQANDLVERFHRQLKAALTAHCSPERWTEALSLVLLGIRTAFKDDLNCSAAEMIFGVPLKLPGEFLSPSNNSFWPNPLNYVQRLRSHMQNLQALPIRFVCNPIFIPTDLKTCSHILLCHDAVRKPLQPIYDGPFKVLKRGEKTFTILQNGKESAIPIDGVRPAYLDKRVT